MTRRDYRCTQCQYIFEVISPLGADPVSEVRCPQCVSNASRYFGTLHDVPINYGYRESRYATKTDADIAKYQFTNL